VTTFSYIGRIQIDGLLGPLPNPTQSLLVYLGAVENQTQGVALLIRVPGSDEIRTGDAWQDAEFEFIHAGTEKHVTPGVEYPLWHGRIVGKMRIDATVDSGPDGLG